MVQVIMLTVRAVVHVRHVLLANIILTLVLLVGAHVSHVLLGNVLQLALRLVGQRRQVNIEVQ